tara:strand:- start:215 stop:709 length:495 start_codon:yes stop_codon:yes gene_type:complete
MQFHYGIINYQTKEKLMGDRAIVVLKKEVMTDGVTHTAISPQMYLHWHGSPDNVGLLIDKLAETMEGRVGDLSYAFARLVGIAHESIAGNLSLGVYSNNFKDDDIWENVHKISHGDNGTYVIDVDDYEIVRCYETYVSDGPDDFEIVGAEETIVSNYARKFIKK